MRLALEKVVGWVVAEAMAMVVAMAAAVAMEAAAAVVMVMIAWAVVAIAEALAMSMFVAPSCAMSSELDTAQTRLVRPHQGLCCRIAWPSTPS